MYHRHDVDPRKHLQRLLLRELLVQHHEASGVQPGVALDFLEDALELDGLVLTVDHDDLGELVVEVLKDLLLVREVRWDELFAELRHAGSNGIVDPVVGAQDRDRAHLGVAPRG